MSSNNDEYVIPLEFDYQVHNKGILFVEGSNDYSYEKIGTALDAYKYHA